MAKASSVRVAVDVTNIELFIDLVRVLKILNEKELIPEAEKRMINDILEKHKIARDGA